MERAFATRLVSLHSRGALSADELAAELRSLSHFYAPDHMSYAHDPAAPVRKPTTKAGLIAGVVALLATSGAYLVYRDQPSAASELQTSARPSDRAGGSEAPQPVAKVTSTAEPQIDAEPELVHEESAAAAVLPEATAVEAEASGYSSAPAEDASRHSSPVEAGVQPPAALHYLGGYVTPEDYPLSALNAGAEGTTTFKLQISEAGRPTGCTIVRSSGSADLDNTTCRIMMQRARFRPAKDALGNATAGTLVHRIQWRLAG